MGVRVDRSRSVVALDTADSTYAFAIDPAGLVRHLYWGPPVPRMDDFEVPPWGEVSTHDPLAEITPEEFPAAGGLRYSNLALVVRFGDGATELRLSPDGIDSDDSAVTVHLRDQLRWVRVELRYEVVSEFGLIRRWVRVHNDGAEPIDVVELASAQFHLPRDDLRLHHVGGHWGAEWVPFSQPVGSATTVLESRRGISSHNHQPFVVLDAGASEDSGEVWGAALAWSGSTRAVIDPTPYGDVVVTLGCHPWQGEWRLDPGETATAPPVIAGYSAAGLTGWSHKLHRYVRAHINPAPRPVLFNSWEASGFDVDEAAQLELAARAAAIGVELFVIDDGWFGRRSSSADGLGDWWPNPDKFPSGLDTLIDRVHELGMRFGLWVEPEMVSPASDLFAAHPEWIYRDQVHPPDASRGQYVLNLTEPAVPEHLFAVLDGLLTRHRIDYLKWDANRPLSAVGATRGAHRRHTRALSDVVSRLKAAHPQLLIEACAGGGGRIDLGALTVFDDVWTSDNTDAADRLDIQRGVSLLFPAKVMRSWITDVPNFLTRRSLSLEFRAHVAMTGSLGIGMDLNAADDAELAALAGYVATYRRLRPLVQEGVAYRLPGGPPEHHFLQFLDGEHGRHAVLFAFVTASRMPHRAGRARPRGLDPTCTYRYQIGGEEYFHSGAWLMQQGVQLWWSGDYSSQLIEFHA